jgi:hypothetical protein
MFAVVRPEATLTVLGVRLPVSILAKTAGCRSLLSGQMQVSFLQGFTSKQLAS